MGLLYVHGCKGGGIMRRFWCTCVEGEEGGGAGGGGGVEFGSRAPYNRFCKVNYVRG